jgi:hypothetical protein
MSATRAVPALVVAALAQVARLRMAPSPEHASAAAQHWTNGERHGVLEKAVQQM